MRRIDREITDVKSIEAFIAKEQTSGKDKWQYSDEMLNSAAVFQSEC